MKYFASEDAKKKTTTTKKTHTHTYTSLSNDYATMNHFSYNNTYKKLLALFKCNFTAQIELKLINPSN